MWTQPKDVHAISTTSIVPPTPPLFEELGLAVAGLQARGNWTRWDPYDDRLEEAWRCRPDERAGRYRRILIGRDADDFGGAKWS